MDHGICSASRIWLIACVWSKNDLQVARDVNPSAPSWMLKRLFRSSQASIRNMDIWSSWYKSAKFGQSIFNLSSYLQILYLNQELCSINWICLIFGPITCTCLWWGLHWLQQRIVLDNTNIHSLYMRLRGYKKSLSHKNRCSCPQTDHGGLAHLTHCHGQIARSVPMPLTFSVLNLAHNEKANQSNNHCRKNNNTAVYDVLAYFRLSFQFSLCFFFCMESR